MENQLKTWDQLMRLNIRAHTALQAFNQLPRDKLAAELVQKDELNKSQSQQVKKNVFNALELLLEAQSTLSDAMKNQTEDPNEEISSSEDEQDERSLGKATSKDDSSMSEEDEPMEQDEHTDKTSPKKRSTATSKKDISTHRLQAINKILKGREKEYEQVRNSILTEWDERSKTQFKKAAKGSKKDFSALDTDIISQIERASHDSEIYDDDDFFQTLLKEVMERRSQNTTDPIAISKQWLEVQKLRQRRKKSKTNVDCKASKGRKTRYVAISKLVNFFPATPESVPWSHEKRNELFKSLFSG